AINPDGTKKWEFETGGNVMSSPAIGSDGIIYVGSDDNNLYAIEAGGSTGENKPGGSIWRDLPTAVGQDYRLSFVTQAAGDDAEYLLGGVVTNRVEGAISLTNTIPQSADWVTNTVRFTAARSSTPLTIRTESAAVWLDTIELIGPGPHNLAEEPLDVLSGERAMGEWTLEVRDHRVGGDPADPELSVREESVEGLRVLRLVHRLEHARLSESFSKPAVERVFERVLDAEQPDLVHFQHLIHTSVGLVDVARAAGKATVVTCHDYWALCARVQLIRPDGQRCGGNMGAGCLPCVKDRAPAEIPLARLLGQAAPGPLRGMAEAMRATPGAPPALRRTAEEYLDLCEREEVVPAAYAACDLMISPSRYLRGVYLESGHFDPERLIFSENGLRTDHVQALQKTPDPEGRLRFGFVGSLVWYKGVDVLVRAMQRMTAEECVLHVYGDFQPESDEHHAELARLADGAQVEFHGRFDNSKLSEVHAQIDVLVVPSLWVENAPVTIQEAFLTDTPLLVSDIGGMAEYVPDGQNGLQFRVGDDEDLARKMLRLLSEPGLIGDLSTSFPEVKTMVQNAAEMEFRYRALCSRVREVRSTAREFRASECARRGGPVVSQGEDLLLLRPGGAFVEYDLGHMEPGAVLLHLTLLALGSESDVEQGGHLTLDGVEIGRIPAFTADGCDQSPTLSFEAQLKAGGGRLRIESALEPGQSEAHLRIVRLVVDRAVRVVDTAGAS
ncbi:MAG: glycosyltransferase, partial [bacterium]